MYLLMIYKLYVSTGHEDEKKDKQLQKKINIQ